jgi:hypothetical protein
MEVAQDLHRIESVIIADDLAAMSASLHTTILRLIQVPLQHFCSLMDCPQPIDEVSTHFMSSEDFRRLTSDASKPS